MNSKLSPKDRNALKGAIRRAFSRSELRRKALTRAIALDVPEEFKLDRPRVKTWYQCPECTNYFAGYQMEVDHREPVIPLNTSFEDMSLDAVVDRTWCDEKNLNAICKECHNEKSKEERKERKRMKGSSK